jgi:hypothetical protein
MNLAVEGDLAAFEAVDDVKLPEQPGPVDAGTSCSLLTVAQSSSIEAGASNVRRWTCLRASAWSSMSSFGMPAAERPSR